MKITDMYSLITTVYRREKDAIYRLDTNNGKVFYASLYKGDTDIFPEKIVFSIDDFNKRYSIPENTSFLVIQFQRAMKQLNWDSRYQISSNIF